MPPDPEKAKKKPGDKLRSAFTRVLSNPTTTKSKSTTQPQSIRYENTTTSILTSNPTYYKAPDPFPLTAMAPANPFSSFARSSDSNNKDSTKKESLIIRFYDPYTKAADAHGRTQEDLLAWDDAHLEHSHNYIQILFPLPEGSPYNYAAPVINQEVMEAFHARPELRNRLRRSLLRILDFYGFKAVGEEDAEEIKEEKEREVEETDVEVSTKDEAAPSSDEPPADAPQTSADAQYAPKASTSAGLISEFVVQRGPKWSQNSRNWNFRFDHNHLRITRILRCLRVLGLQTEMEAFYSALCDVYDSPDSKIGERSMSYWTKAVERPLWIAPDDDKIMWLKRWGQEQKAKAEAEAEAGQGDEERASKKAKTSKQETEGDAVAEQPEPTESSVNVPQVQSKAVDMEETPVASSSSRDKNSN